VGGNFRQVGLVEGWVRRSYPGYLPEQLPEDTDWAVCRRSSSGKLGRAYSFFNLPQELDPQVQVSMINDPGTSDSNRFLKLWQSRSQPTCQLDTKQKEEKKERERRRKRRKERETSLLFSDALALFNGIPWARGLAREARPCVAIDRIDRSSSLITEGLLSAGDN
jgi:hypothetical protein